MWSMDMRVDTEHLILWSLGFERVCTVRSLVFCVVLFRLLLIYSVFRHLMFSSTYISFLYPLGLETTTSGLLWYQSDMFTLHRQLYIIFICPGFINLTTHMILKSM